MRCYIKQKILDSCNILMQNVKLFQAHSGQTITEAIYQNLCDYQNMFVELGEYIEKNCTEKKFLVQKLEWSCECLYRISQTDLDINLLNDIEENISFIRNNILDEKTDKILIYFLPYKAAMWDCFESIWECAKDDERCEVKIMPIPYIEKASGRVICELDQFDSDIPLIDYRLVKLEEVHPDIIYIHNPYDQANKVTSVVENYFSAELKKCTEKLVYVPYYLSSMYRNEQRLIEKACLPGSINSDIVILQSQVQKDIYKKYGIDCEKYFVAGSPKTDAVIKYIESNNKETVKKEWGIDGEKVVMLNTSITYFLNKEKWGEILFEILRIIDEKDITLLWRPHPLLEATMKAMNREGYKEYKKALAYAADKNKIYVDYSPNPLKAILISDALISDYSSLVVQYYLTGKPIYSLDGIRKCVQDSILIFNYYDVYLKSEGITVEQYIDMILETNDYKKNIRLERIKEYPMLMDGMAGERIHKYVLKYFTCRS